MRVAGQDYLVSGGGPVNIAQAARKLGLNPRTVMRRITEEKTLGAVRDGGRWIITDRDIVAYRQQHQRRHEPVAAPVTGLRPGGAGERFLAKWRQGISDKV